jgi:PPK2 family polyphosphate:nucleotide phosphotransferase
MKKIKLSAISTKADSSANELEIKATNATLREQLSGLQYKLFAKSEKSLLVILQGLDASGKDGTVKQVFSGVNPAGCRVKSFKVPSLEETRHDFLWRIHKECPEKGMIQIFNRSHYEDILVPSIRQLITPREIKKRLKAINDFEQMLSDQQTVVLKFYLHVSLEEQLSRIEKRKTDPDKAWKYQASDLEELKIRDQYIKTYERIFHECNEIPWKIIPADQKWYRDYLVLNELLKKLHKVIPA